MSFNSPRSFPFSNSFNRPPVAIYTLPAFGSECPLIRPDRNSSLQAAYFILAARALGLDGGPMSGFDEDKLNAEFFPDGKWKVNLLCNLGYGDQSKLYARNPRVEFEEASMVV